MSGEIYQLRDKTRKMLPEGTPEDLCKSVNGQCVFFTHVFKGGYILGFYSHSPWGNIRDQEQGWVLLSPDFKEIDSCATRVSGQNAGEGFRFWRKEIKQRFGRATKLASVVGQDEDGYEFPLGDMIWQLSECD